MLVHLCRRLVATSARCWYLQQTQSGGCGQCLFKRASHLEQQAWQEQLHVLC